MLELLTPAEMAEADRLTIAAGTPGIALMEVAGRAVADAVAPWSRETPVVIACGPGNNGGDGFVAARLLAERGYRVQLGLLGALDRLKGDAALAAAAWKGETLPLGALDFAGAGVIIDALFGAGLDRGIAGEAAEAIAAINASKAHVVAVDLPSGIQGETGEVLGVAVRADETVTFFRPKPGHVLMPGRAHVGRLAVADIGISPAVLDAISPRACLNRPELWLPVLPTLKVDGHKYDRGHAVIVSGGMTQTGAARLAARAALRVGAGLVTLASPPDALAVNAAHLTAIMLKRIEGAAGLSALLGDHRLNSVGLGPGLGPAEVAGPLVEAALASQAAVVIDADGLSAFRDAPERLFAAIRARSAPVVLTPHDGEFARLFPDLAALPGKLDRARQAAARSGAVVLLKGADTTVADPEGRAAIADNAPPYLATAGSGDTLAGMIVGLLADGMPVFEATAAAVWLHGEAGALLGRGLIAEDLADALPRVFKRLFV
ncbi:bifunctional NAD(P)H-hydrate repair enzyme [Kaistia sp. 32K]|uniref:NAD(P)H-hydrate dehydratase n=1 Tax=Kaistia sp. 32K TaxID=2795690 RepID=UPI001937F1AB|nr:NAD(P)H-hydrate dehydratase [Kaistia sp. 32K]BCP53726.1 bifunctional NAD(P)H-hydrate repair enzyme [Kaistia sp. 32K]